MSKLTKADLIEELNHDLKMKHVKLAQWQKQFESDPFEALDGADNAIKFAAHCKVVEMILELLKTEPLSRVIDILHRKAISGAMYPQLSTSPSSNFASICLTRAYTERWEWLKEIVITEEAGS